MEVDLSQLDPGTRGKMDEIFRGQFDRMLYEAALRQREVAARNYLNRPKARDGFGPRLFEVDAVIDGLWRQVYGAGYTEDKEVMKFLAKRNPEILARGTGNRIQVGYSAVGRGTKGSKRYVDNKVNKGKETR